MGTTTKIIYGGFLAILLILLFLIFQMQKSAQLTLDVENIEQSIHKKNQELATVQQKLEETLAAVADAEAKSTIIPKLEDTIQASEKEKLAYMQQLDELQEQLKNADSRIAELSRLQEEYKQQQLLLAEAEKAKRSVEMQAAQAAKSIKNIEKTLTQRDERISQFNATLEQKDLVIKSLKEKLAQTAEKIALLQSTISDNKLNLTLVLDELGLKNQLVEKLTLKIEQINAAIQKKGHVLSDLIDNKTAIETEIKTLLDTATPEQHTDNKDEITACYVDLEKTKDKLRLAHEELQQLKVAQQALFPSAYNEIEELKLINDTLQNNIKEQDAVIKSLRDEILTKETQLATDKTEMVKIQEDDQVTNNEINRLLLIEQNNLQELAQLKSTLADKENELKEAMELAEKVSAPSLRRLQHLKPNWPKQQSKTEH